VSSKNFKSGYVTICGKPNVGKSTLLNYLLGTKLAAVTPKPQTTRHKILGILNREDAQIIFVDTPGIFKPGYYLQKIMVKTAMSAVKDTDLVLLMVEPDEYDDDILDKIEKHPVVIAINKIDKLKRKESLLPLIEEYSKHELVKEVVPISALKGVNVDELLQVIIDLLPEGEPYFPQDMLSDQNERFFVEEIIREKIFELYREEVPYASTVVIDEFQEKEKKHYIRAIIYVESEGEKGIIIGKGGEKIKKLGIKAREEIELLLGHPVYLELWVKVRKGWRKKPEILREFGYHA